MTPFGIAAGVVGIGVTSFFLVIAWSLVWKGWALWVAAQNNSKVWFIILLLVNTAGILEIIYIFVLSNHEAYKNIDPHVAKGMKKVKKAVSRKKK